MSEHNILVFVDGLFFSAKIGEVIRTLGGKPVITADMDRVAERLGDAGAAAIIVDLSLMGTDAVEIITQLKQQPDTMGVPMLAYGQHTSPELLARAKDAGCEQVMPRSNFVNQLPGFLENCMAGVCKDGRLG